MILTGEIFKEVSDASSEGMVVFLSKSPSSMLQPQARNAHRNLRTTLIASSRVWLQY